MSLPVYGPYREGASIRARRVKASITIGMAARHLKITAASWSDIERGQRQPTEAEREKIARLLPDPAPYCVACGDQRAFRTLNRRGFWEAHPCPQCRDPRLLELFWLAGHLEELSDPPPPHLTWVEYFEFQGVKDV